MHLREQFIWLRRYFHRKQFTHKTIMKTVIIGGVAGGATAAARLRRNNEEVEIVLLEKGKYISYANCGLPYYIGGVIADRDRLFVQTPEKFGNRFNIDVRVESEVIFINKEDKKLTIRNANGEEYDESYDKLLISTGAQPVKPPLPGIDNQGIFTLRNVSDTDQIKEYIDKHGAKNAVVIGAGFIGLEMAENLHELGAKVSIVEMANQVMAPIDCSMATLVHQHLTEKGVNLYLEEAVSSFSKEDKSITVNFKSGKSITTDLVILSIGVRPLTTLAEKANLELGPTGGVKVNANLQTSDSSIYAIGDVIEFPHPITGKPWLNYLAGPANRQGRIVADNILGANIGYEGSIGTSIAKVFDYTVASTGLAAKHLQREEIPYLSSIIHGFSHATYYPNSLPLSIKITFDPKTGKLFGAQIVGYDGVDKRIDQIALIIKHKGSIYDLMEIEHAYAPPFSSAKDPIAIAGYAAENIILGKVKTVNWRDCVDIDPNEVVLLDVCTTEEHAVKTLPGAINVPLDEMRDRLDEIPRDKKVYLFCAVGLRGYLAYRLLAGQGFTNIYSLNGGTKILDAATMSINNRHISNDNQSDESSIMPSEKSETIKIDACGLQCPGPIMRLKQSVDEIKPGQRIEISSTDPAFARDAESWCGSTGHQYISKKSEKGVHTITIEKSSDSALAQTTGVAPGRGKTFIMFSDDLDKALATFILANGAAATGQKVTIFFTFWGLNVIKKAKKPKVKKDFLGKMFSMMLPSHSKQLKLSQMNMGGMGRRMMRHIMKSKNIDSLESLRRQALFNGVEFIACQMSMDVMGVNEAELMNEVTLGGVATYMERADQANGNLFI